MNKEGKYMLAVFYYASIVSGFLFPAFLINAIRKKEEDGVPRASTIGACVTFGIIVITVIQFTMA